MYKKLYSKTETNKGFPITTENLINWIPDVWELFIPPKIKLFLWKLFQGALATGENLGKRGLGIGVTCSRCQQFESASHIVWECPFAQEAWNFAPILLDRELLRNISFQSVWGKLKNTPCLPPVGITRGSFAAWLVWNLWLSRNNSVFNQSWKSVGDAINGAIKGALEWSKAQVPDQRITKVPRSQLSLPLGMIRCRVDASWRIYCFSAGFGWEFGTEPNKVTGWRAEANVASVLMAESLALRSAVEDAIIRGLHSVVFETDSMELVKAINGLSHQASIYGVLEDLKQLKSLFYLFRMVFIPRSSNLVVDELAKNILRSFVNHY